MSDVEFKPFPKIARLNREIIITEKIDGTNAAVGVLEDGTVYAQSRTRIITPNADNFGFAKWVEDNKDTLRELGTGAHFGEWWGNGIQRGYGLEKGEKRFSLFNTSRWSDGDDYIGDKTLVPTCCNVVPVIYQGIMDTNAIRFWMDSLRSGGSWAALGFMNPEGIVIYHTAGNLYFKATINKDKEWKGKS